ncbi:hypothetical protein DCAR_0207225 [Daucus carota subsp. sativus]|uniref:Uncharacterized protein n=1 Tax=Daucus carota subsp. sativus TaxID=79200 RepID=A0AAF1APE9_DAUCS|nr:PREDICTED: uncharacterized protein LOC108207582 [Daucus carota subsp. sativus]WOG87992.1 hypothetical protein DCAR_0207225 [Daucus carota subsp. sativus]
MATEFDVPDHYERNSLYDPALLWGPLQISDEHFNLFHYIDRMLFYILFRQLGRNVDESMYIVAFLIWLEKIQYCGDAVYTVISWSLPLIHQLSQEVAAFLLCLHSEIGDESLNLFLLGTLCSGRDIDVVHFHNNRIKILMNVNKIVVEICTRAFRDIIAGNPVVVQPPFHAHVAGGGFPQLGFQETLGSGNYQPPNPRLANILEDPNADLSEIFGGLQLVDGCEDEPDVAPDDRTIFLTFSKGYFIPEVDIREFFTRIFGNFIEDIHMQEVPSDQQPLYARMVCRSSAIIPKIAPPGNKSLYSINGKHVYAKKYERHNKREKKRRGSTSQAKNT